jgi:hypothetical protein
MGHRKILFLAARLCFGGFVLLTSFYCLLAYIPFTYHWFIQNPLVYWFPVFVRFHAYIFLIALAAVAPTLLADLRNEETKRLTVAFVLLNFAAAAVFIVHPFLSHLPNDSRSFIWSLLSLLPLAWIAIIDFISTDASAQRPANTVISPIPAVLAAIFVTVLYASIAALRSKPSIADLVAIGWSFLSHLVVFLSCYLALHVAYLVLKRFAPTQARSIAWKLLAFAVSALLLRKLVLATLGFNNWWADVYAIAFSLALLSSLQGLRIRLSNTHSEHAIAEGQLGWSFRIVWLCALIAVAIAVPRLIGTMDWNFLLQKLSAVAVWAGAFLFFYRIHSGTVAKRPILILLLAGLMGFAGYEALAYLQTDPRTTIALDRYAGNDVSFKVARDLLAPAVDDESYRSFYSFLQQNTGLPESAKVAAPNIKLVDDFLSRPNQTNQTSSSLS